MKKNSVIDLFLEIQAIAPSFYYIFQQNNGQFVNLNSGHYTCCNDRELIFFKQLKLRKVYIYV